MLRQISGRSRGRYIALVVFLFVAFTLWRNHDTLPGGNTVLVTPPSTSGIHYVPSSYDWSRARVFHPFLRTTSPPRGSFRTFPQVQSYGTLNTDQLTLARRDAIKAAFVKSWEAYKSRAWGEDELAPMLGAGRKLLCGWGAQVIDALDTLWIMDLKDDFNLAVRHVATIDWAATTDHVNVFEVTIRYLGGLISAYELSGEQVLLYKAMELGDLLFAAFDTPNRLPARWLDVYKAKHGQLQADTRMSGAAGGTLCLEFTRLTQITGEPKYYDATERLKRFFHRNQNETQIPGLWPHTMNYRKKKMEKALYTLGAGSDSMYEYLPKMHALLGGLDLDYEKMTVYALDAARDNILFKPMNPRDENLLLAGKATVNKNKAVTLAPEMEHLACFAGGMYALAGKLLDRSHYVDIGARLTRGCIWAYDSFETNIMPEISELVACDSRHGSCPYDANAMPSGRAKNLPPGFVRVRDTTYQLRPEALESVFYMWRITGERTYREAAWRMWQGIVRETETELAFATVNDVRHRGSPHLDQMETFFMGETLKYLYLTFEQHHVLSLDDWVFNTEAHPFKRPGR